MFGTIRRHQTWLWVVVATITIVSFIVYFNPASRSGGRGGRAEGNYGVVNGHTVTEDELSDAAKEVVLFFRLNGQRVDPGSTEVTIGAYQTIFLDSKAEELGIQITPEAASLFARRSIIGNERLDDFVKTVLTPLQLTEADFDRFLRHRAALLQLVAVTGTSGSVATPGEAESVLYAQSRSISASLAFFAYSNYVGKVTNSAAEISEYYTNNKVNYMVPEKMVVNYVKYNASNYLADARTALTNLDRQVADNLEQLGTNLFPETKTPEESKARIRELLLLRKAQSFAAQKANAFALQLDSLDSQHQTPDAFVSLARSNGLTVLTTAPFDEDGPEDLKVPFTFARAALNLNTNIPFSPMIPAEDGAYVLGFKEHVAPREPKFSEVEAKVTADFRQLKAQQLAGEAASKFSGTVEDQLNVNNGVTLPKDFASIAAENDVKIENLPPLSQTGTNFPPDLDKRIGRVLLLNLALNTPAGTASKAQAAPEGAFVLYVDKLLPPDPAKLKTDLPGFLAKLRQTRQGEAFDIWINEQMNRDPGMVAILQQYDKPQGAAPAPAPAPRK